jgi:hypothetical protein
MAEQHDPLPPEPPAQVVHHPIEVVEEARDRHALRRDGGIMGPSRAALVQ